MHVHMVRQDSIKVEAYQSCISRRVYVIQPLSRLAALPQDHCLCICQDCCLDCFASLLIQSTYHLLQHRCMLHSCSVLLVSTCCLPTLNAHDQAGMMTGPSTAATPRCPCDMSQFQDVQVVEGQLRSFSRLLLAHLG